MPAGHYTLSAVQMLCDKQPLLHQVNICTFRKAHLGAGLVKAGRFLLVSGVSAELGRKNQSGDRDLKVCSAPGDTHLSGSYGEQNAGFVHSHHTCTEALKMESLMDVSPADTFSRKKGRGLSSTGSFIRTTFYTLWLQEVCNHCWFGLVPSGSHSRSAHQGVAQRKSKGLVQEIWYRSLCSALKGKYKRKHKDS